MEATIDHHTMRAQMAMMCVEKALHDELRDL